VHSQRLERCAYLVVRQEEHIFAVAEDRVAVKEASELPHLVPQQQRPILARDALSLRNHLMLPTVNVPGLDFAARTCPPRKDRPGERQLPVECGA
jgi:hypothetical protein